MLQRLHDEAPLDHFTLGWLIGSLRKRSFGIIMLLLALAPMAPGVSIVAGVLLMIPGFQMIAGRPAPVFARRIAGYPLPARHLAALVPPIPRSAGRTSRATRSGLKSTAAAASAAALLAGRLGFWGPAGPARWVLTGTILLTVLLYLAASYGMNVWNRAIFDALERRDGGTVLYLSLVYVPLLAASVAVMLLQVYARMTTQRRWRAWLNNHLLDRWLKNGRYYQLNLVGGDHQNPEYRIADDVRVATESPVEFATGLLTAVLVGGDLHSSCCGRSVARSRSPSAASRSPFRAFWSSPP